MTSTSPRTTYPPVIINSTTTSYLPRTAPFTAPEACASYYMVDGKLSKENGSVIEIDDFVGWSPSYQFYVNKSAGCFPDEIMTVQNLTEVIYGLVYDGDTNSEIREKVHTGYILAPFSCLDGWNQVYVSAVTPSTTTTACCPSGYEARINYDYSTADIDCTSLISPGFGTSSLPVTYGNALTITQGSSSTTKGVVQTTTINQTMTVYGAAITGWNFELDVSSSETSASESSGGLSTGAKAGIGVGVAVGVLLIVGALVFLIRSRKKPNNNQKAMAELSDDSARAELHGPHNLPAHELHSGPDQPEMMGSRPPQELQGMSERPPLELDGSDRHGTQIRSGVER